MFVDDARCQVAAIPAIDTSWRERDACMWTPRLILCRKVPGWGLTPPWFKDRSPVWLLFDCGGPVRIYQHSCGALYADYLHTGDRYANPNPYRNPHAKPREPLFVWSRRGWHPDDEGHG